MTRATNGLKLLHRRLSLLRNTNCRLMRRFALHLKVLDNAMSAITFMTALGALVVLALYAGFESTANPLGNTRSVLRAAQLIFITNITIDILLHWNTKFRRRQWLKWTTEAALFVTIIPMVSQQPDHPWLPWLSKIVYSTEFLGVVLFAYSVVYLSYGVMHLLSRRTNPSLILSASFLIFIIIGTLLLMLPRCTVGSISLVDSLFVATSAVCITGLTPVDIANTFTPLGQCVLAVLVQIGALGVMTFTSFFALFFSGTTSIYSQLMVKDLVYSKTFGSLIPTLLYILGFTIIIEIIGASLIFISIHDSVGMTLTEEIRFAAFHSVSAFCNAGFSNTEGGLAAPAIMHGNQWMFIVIAFLVAAGSIGFPTLVNFKDALFERLRSLTSRIRDIRFERRVHLYDTNTKVVLVTWGALFIGTILVFWLLEHNNSMRGMTAWEQFVQSVFNATTPRSSGFSTINPAGFLNVTIVVIMFMMWIGGASQSTGGGIKVNTFALMLLNLKATLTGRDSVTAFNRTIAHGSLRRANAVIALSIIAYLTISALLLWLEPTLPARSLLFEACSALFTVGSSLGITPHIGTGSKILLSAAMFLGRVGIISLLMGVIGQKTSSAVKYPTDNIIIN